MSRFCKIFTLLGLIYSSIGNAMNSPLQESEISSENSQNTALFIHQTLQEMNETIFSTRHLYLDLLKNCPETIPVLVEWIYEDWHSYDTSLTKEKLSEGFNRRLNDDKLPLTFVLLKDSRPIGVISLKNQAASELSDLKDSDPWGGSFHIAFEEREQGFGEDLAKALTVVAKRLGYKKIWFYTSASQNVG